MTTTTADRNETARRPALLGTHETDLRILAAMARLRRPATASEVLAELVRVHPWPQPHRRTVDRHLSGLAALNLIVVAEPAGRTAKESKLNDAWPAAAVTRRDRSRDRRDPSGMGRDDPPRPAVTSRATLPSPRGRSAARTGDPAVRHGGRVGRTDRVTGRRGGVGGPDDAH